MKAVKSVINNEPYLKLPYGKVTVEYLTQDMTLVPDTLFMKENKEEIFNFNLSDTKDATVRSTPFTGTNSQIIFSVHKELNSFFEDTYPSLKITHAIVPLVNTLMNEAEDSTALYIYVQPSIMKVILMDRKQVRFCNIFRYKTPEDFIYYLMYAVHQLELDNEKIRLILLGEIIEDSAIYKQIYKYIRNISFGKRPEQVQLSDVFQLPQQFYFNLFCEV